MKFRNSIDSIPMIACGIRNKLALKRASEECYLNSTVLFSKSGRLHNLMESKNASARVSGTNSSSLSPPCTAAGISQTQPSCSRHSSSSRTDQRPWRLISDTLQAPLLERRGDFFHLMRHMRRGLASDTLKHGVPVVVTQA